MKVLSRLLFPTALIALIACAPVIVIADPANNAGGVVDIDLFERVHCAGSASANRAKATGLTNRPSRSGFEHYNARAA
jgi:hypothetical protein